MAELPNNWRIAIRADANAAIGYGHIRRTLTVVHALRNATGLTIDVRYLMRLDSDANWVREANCEVTRLQTGSTGEAIEAVTGPCDLLILDSYATTMTDLDQWRQVGIPIVVFDDGCRLKRYPVAMVIDSSPAAIALNYVGLPQTRWLLGATYFPLRPDFRGLPRRAERDGRVEHVLVTFGGSDPEDITARVLDMLVSQHIRHVSVLLGPGYHGQAERIGREHRSVRLIRSLEHPGELFASADLAICGAGMTSLELAYLGVPMLLIALSKDQQPIARSLHERGAAILLGWHEQVGEQRIAHVFREVSTRPEKLKRMTTIGPTIIDGQGADRIAHEICRLLEGEKPDAVEP